MSFSIWYQDTDQPDVEEEADWPEDEAVASLPPLDWPDEEREGVEE